MSKADEPEAIGCYFCGGPMIKKHRVETERFARVLWRCTACSKQYWKMYEDEERGSNRRERKQRWH